MENFGSNYTGFWGAFLCYWGNISGLAGWAPTRGARAGGAIGKGEAREQGAEGGHPRGVPVRAGLWGEGELGAEGGNLEGRLCGGRGVWRKMRTIIRDSAYY